MYMHIPVEFPKTVSMTDLPISLHPILSDTKACKDSERFGHSTCSSQVLHILVHNELPPQGGLQRLSKGAGFDSTTGPTNAVFNATPT